MALQIEGLPEVLPVYTVGFDPQDTKKIAITRAVIGETVEDFWRGSVAMLEQTLDDNDGRLTYVANRVLLAQADTPEIRKTDSHEVPRHIWDSIVRLAGKSGLEPEVVAGLAPVHRVEVLRRDAGWSRRWGAYQTAVISTKNAKVES